MKITTNKEERRQRTQGIQEVGGTKGAKRIEYKGNQEDRRTKITEDSWYRSADRAGGVERIGEQRRQGSGNDRGHCGQGNREDRGAAGTMEEREQGSREDRKTSKTVEQRAQRSREDNETLGTGKQSDRGQVE